MDTKLIARYAIRETMGLAVMGVALFWSASRMDGWALAAGGLCAVLIVVRTALEDRTLRAELSGYEDYAREVRYRLVPGIW